MERMEFARLVRDALANLYDNAALETHPLADFLPKPAEAKVSRAEHLRAALLKAIESLRPPKGDDPRDAIPWRPYRILHGRYVEGLDLQALEKRLALSTRHLSREHGRAIAALASILWDQAFPQSRAPKATAEAADVDVLADELGGFEVVPETVDLAQVLRATVDIFRPRAESVGAELILLSLLNYALRMRTEGALVIGLEATPAQLALWARYRTRGQPITQPAEARKETALEVARYWARRLGATLQVQAVHLPSGLEQLVLSWPNRGQPIILVIDDQEAAIRLFERYLRHLPLRVMGLRDPQQALSEAHRLRPRAIILDVMMPTQDGWEVLQALRADPGTSHIPVVICSVWDVPELASTYGASGFVKKPIDRQDLLKVLARLGLLDSSVGSCPEDGEGSPPAPAGIGADAS
jgi:CheY-like chemotaxis protein